MKKQIIGHSALILLVGSFLVLGGASVAHGQGANLLTNPGFESPYSDVGGDPPRQVAQGWLPWHIPRSEEMPSFQNAQPEYAPAAPDTTRIRSGSNAQLYSSFFATHDGGVFQRVSGIPSGTELRFSVYAYVWSTTFGDRNKSEEDGDVLLRVGIDPTGGTDGTSANIVWSTAIEQYDAYREYSVIARATGTAVTVFVRSTVGFPVQNNNIYLDDAVLASTTGSSVTPAATDIVAPSVTPIPSSTPTIPPSSTPTIPSSATATLQQPVQASATPTTPPTLTFTPPPSPTSQPATPSPEGGLPSPTALTLATATPFGTGGVTVPISETFPGTIVHTVRRGDTVGNLATLYNSTTEVIIAANGLDSNALIYVGQGLIIPVRLAAPATSTPTVTPVVIVVTATSGAPGTGGSGGTGGAGGGTETVYVVRPGDTLFNIATRYNTTVAALAQLNGIVNPNRIQVGQQLRVPGTGGTSGGAVPTSPPPATSVAATPPPLATIGSPPTAAPSQATTYVVRPGDNLFRVSLRYNVSMQRLIQLNGIINPNLIFIGQVLTIP